MFGRNKKKRYEISFVLTLIAAILSLALGYAMGAQNAITAARKSAATPPLTSPEPRLEGEAYASDRWKQWRDEDFGKGSVRYIGYELSYPRDFDVLRGELAGSGWIGNPRVRFAFPEDAFRDRPNSFRGASFLVGIADGVTEEECYAEPSARKIDRERLLAVMEINGVAYKTVTLRDGALGNRYDTELYRTYRAGRCLEITLGVATSNVGGNAEGVEKFDDERAWSILRKMLGSFRILDAPEPIEPAAFGTDSRMMP